MSFWNDMRAKLRDCTTASDVTVSVYRKVATSGVNMLGIIVPSFYIGQLSSLSSDYISYVEKFLEAEDRDWGEYLKFMLYIREISKRLLSNVGYLQDPLAQLIRSLEEIYEGEITAPEDELDEEPEPERLEEPENLDDILSDEDQAESEAEKDDEDDSDEDDDENIEAGISREDLNREYEALKTMLRKKLKSAEVPQKVEEELARSIADVYLECMQLARELLRLSRMPDGDIGTLMSILVDIQYGMCSEMKRHLMEDVIIEDRFDFSPGVLTWTAHFLSDFSEKINEGWQTNERTGR